MNINISNFCNCSIKAYNVHSHPQLNVSFLSNQFSSNVFEGQTLCGGKAYSTTLEECCCGKIHTKRSNFQCCGIDYFSKNTQRCCPGSTLRKKGESCLGRRKYSRNAYAYKLLTNGEHVQIAGFAAACHSHYTLRSIHTISLQQSAGFHHF